MHEARAGVGRLERCQAARNFLLIATGERAADNAQRPDHSQPGVRAAQALGSRASIEERIVLAEREGSRVAIHRVRSGQAAEVRHRQQARHAGVIHEQRAAIAIHLEGVDLAARRVLRLSVHGQPVADFGGEIAALPRKAGVVEHSAVDLAQLFQRGHREEGRRNQEGEDAGVVGGPKAGVD